jgi:hypothetical protein
VGTLLVQRANFPFLEFIMFIRLKQLGDDCVLNSDDIRRFRRVDGHVIIEFRDGWAAEYDTEFEQLATLLNAVASEPPTQTPVIHNILIPVAKCDTETYHDGEYYVAQFDASKIDTVSTFMSSDPKKSGAYQTLFTYNGAQFVSPDAYPVIVGKIAAVLGK